MLAQEIIRKKRDGAVLDREEIKFMVKGMARGTVSDAQIGAFAMAIFFRGLTRPECVALTKAMARSGRILDWSEADFDGPVLDKHSSGGVGDKVSLILAPVVAACGGFIPKLSGRGLGHTGGTVDKLESIPGYATAPETARLVEAVRQVGCAIVGTSGDLAPADKRLYAIRDVTGTVESVPLLTASILSKKFAAAPDALVLDVKCGSGAFAATDAFAAELAESLCEVAGGTGIDTVAVVTDMDRVLGTTAGNALEVREAIDFLTGRARDRRLDDVVRALSAELLLLGKLAADPVDAAAKIAHALESGAAAERFQRMVVALGGPDDLVGRPERHLAAAPIVRPVPPPRAGIVERLDVRALGIAVLELGGGRRDPGDRIDHAVGLAEVRGPGDAVGPDSPLAVIHARREADVEPAAAAIRAAYAVGDAAPAPLPVIRRRFAA